MPNVLQPSAAPPLKLTTSPESDSLFGTEFVKLVRQVGADLDGAIVHSRDYTFS